MSTQSTRRGRFRAALTAAVIGGVAAAITLTGCGAGGDGAGGDQSLQRVLDAGTVNMGACLTQPPWGSIAADGTPEGFDVDLSQSLADFLGVKLELHEVTGAGRVPALQTGQDDVMACTFTITDERKKQVDFANPTIAAGTSLLVTKGSDITTVADLSGRKVGVTKGGTAEVLVAKLNPDADLMQFEVPSALFLALEQGQVEAVVDVASTITAEAEKNPNFQIALDGEVGDKTYFALGVAKGNDALLEKVNEFIAQFHESGEDLELYRKWFDREPTFEFIDLPDTVNVD